MATSGLLRMKLNSPTRMLRAKRSLMIFHRGHAPTDDPLLAREVVLADATFLDLLLLQLLALASDALVAVHRLRLGKGCPGSSCDLP